MVDRSTDSRIVTDVVSKTRLGGLDLARFAAALAIVAFHILPYPVPDAAPLVTAVQELALKWAVPFFFAASGFLHGLSSCSATPAWIRGRLVRIGVPYVIWTSLRLIDLRPVTLGTLLKQYLLAIPPSTLWFLWTLMLVSAIAWALLRAGVRPVTLAAGAIVAAVVHAGVTEWLPTSGALSALLHDTPTLALQSPLTWLWVYAGGIALARAGTARERVPAWVPWALLGSVTLVPLVRYAALGGAAADWYAYHFSWGFAGLWHGAFGLAVLLVAQRSRMGSTPLLTRLAGYSLGIYLVHPAIIRILSMLSEQSWVHALDNTPILKVVAVGAVSIAAVSVVSTVPWVRRAVG